ncbi:nuclear transport factor 2 family protein [Rhodococcus sp. NPDC059968]|uniref:nuclear transport factor 2 family protein n=1 Tax=Rhodococcus sp. NPDC059968 TaxID=3347017 RepID=UPI00366EEC29
MSDSEKKVVQAFVEAFSRGDIDTALTHLADDGVIDEAEGMNHSGLYKGGPKGFSKLLVLMTAEMDAAVDSCDYLDAEGVIVTKMALTFTSKKTGRKFPTRVTELYTVKNGRITSLDSYYKDPAGVAALQAEK